MLSGLVAYIPTIGAFWGGAGLITAGKGREFSETVPGFLWRSPASAIMHIIMMLSLAGIPLTAGFLGKFYIVTAGLTAQMWDLVFLFFNNVNGLFYYFRIIHIFISDVPAESEDSSPPIKLPWNTGLTIGILILLVEWLGNYPDPIMPTLRYIGEELTG